MAIFRGIEDAPPRFEATISAPPQTNLLFPLLLALTLYPVYPPPQRRQASQDCNTLHQTSLYRFNLLYFLKMEYPPYYHDNDVGPFSSVTYSLTPDGPGLHELDLKLRDRDVVLIVEGDDEDKTVRILHLYNVREDTLAEAKTAVDGLLGQVKPLGGGGNTGHTVFKMFDKVFSEIKDPVACLLEDANDLELKLEEIDEDDMVHPKRAADTTSELFNPVAELQAACRDFIDRMESIHSRSKMYGDESCPNRRATMLFRAYESVHVALLIYTGERSAKGGLAFDWEKDSYAEQRRLMRQPRYHMCFNGGQHFHHIYGDYPLNPYKVRGEETD